MLKCGYLESGGTSMLILQQEGEDRATGQDILLQDLRILHPLRALCCLLAVLGLNTLNKNLRGEFICGEYVGSAVWKQRNNQL